MNKLILVFIVVIVLDQGTKLIVSLLGGEIIYNMGVSFSNFAQKDPKFLIFLLIISIYLLFNTFRKFWLKHSFAAGLFFGGAVANIIDRVMFGAVRDWLPIPLSQTHNNLADWAIFIGLFSALLPKVMFLLQRNGGR